MSPITEFYTGKTLLVTGATGFMGKVLLEKLVRSLPDIKKIYILIRPKKGFSPQERVKQLTDGVIFSFHNMHQKVFEKIEAISGDITKDDFDISESDKQKLINEVSVVFHIAASVRMDLGLKEAVVTNTNSTYELFKFCTSIKNLKSVIHLSTAFCNAEITYMEEKVYPLDVDPYKIMDMVDWMDEKSLDIITKKLLGPLPNTYVYSKRLSEMIAVDMGEKIPLIIVRPSLVVPSTKEPVGGWIDNFNGPIGLLIAAGKGIMRVVLVDPSVSPQIIPVDIAINNVILSGYERATIPYSNVPVINSTNGNYLRYTMEHFLGHYIEVIKNQPFKYVLWNYELKLTKNSYLYLLLTFFFQFIPALILDFLLIMFLQKPFLISLQQRLFVAMNLLKHFSLKEWNFVNTNCANLNRKLTKEDKEKYFGIEIFKDIDFQKCAYEASTILKKYLLKEYTEEFAFYRIRDKILDVLNFAIKMYFLYVVLKWSFLYTKKWF